MREDNDGSRKDAPRAKTGDSAADYERLGCGGHAADQGAELEDEEGTKIDPLDVEEGVDLSVQQLEGAGGEEVGAAIPANIVQRVELVSYARDSGGYDGIVLQQPPSAI